LTTTVTLLVFATTTLVNEPAATTALAVIILLSIGLDVWWKRARGARRPSHAAVPTGEES
jgi:uncharacterized iron-regulated membrane protein